MRLEPPGSVETSLSFDLVRERYQVSIIAKETENSYDPRHRISVRRQLSLGNPTDILKFMVTKSSGKEQIFSPTADISFIWA